MEVVQQLFGDAQLFNRMSIQESADSCQKAAASACSAGHGVSAHTGRAGTGLRFALGKPQFVKVQ